jgi:hypothetical protein
MKTDALIDLLAKGAGPAPRAVAARRLMPAAGIGLLASSALALLTIGPVGAAMLATPAFWLKVSYSATLVSAAVWLVARESRPAARTAPAWRAVAAVVLAMAIFGAVSLSAAPDTTQALMGQTWSICPRNVFLLSLPALATALWAVRGLAPTRPRAAGVAAGLFAGAAGAFGYALACPETSPAFVAVWYSAGIGLSGVVGAVLGPRVLRW